MALRLGDVAPDFTADSTAGTINFHEYLGDSWGVLFSHPKDFTPVCTTELGRVAALKPESTTQREGARPVRRRARRSPGVERRHRGDPGHGVELPAARRIPIAPSRISTTWSTRTRTTRSPCVGLRRRSRQDGQVEPDLPASTGRNFDEILRTIDSLQLTAEHKVATPVDWEQGQDVIIVPAVSDEEAAERFPAGFTTVKPYLRYTEQPG